MTSLWRCLWFCCREFFSINWPWYYLIPYQNLFRLNDIFMVRKTGQLFKILIIFHRFGWYWWRHWVIVLSRFFSQTILLLSASLMCCTAVVSCLKLISRIVGGFYFALFSLSFHYFSTPAMFCLRTPRQPRVAVDFHSSFMMDKHHIRKENVWLDVIYSCIIASLSTYPLWKNLIHHFIINH